MKARVGDEKIEVYRDIDLTVPLGLQLDAGSEVKFEKIVNRRGEYVGRMVLPDGRFGFVNPQLQQNPPKGVNSAHSQSKASIKSATSVITERVNEKANAKPLGERLVDLDEKLGGKSDQWGDAALSGLAAGIVMAVARNKLGGGVGFLVAASAYGFLILRLNFTVLQRLFAAALTLSIGFYWREILAWFK